MYVVAHARMHLCMRNRVFDFMKGKVGYSRLSARIESEYSKVNNF